MVMYRSSIVIERMDDIIMEGNSPTITPPHFMEMVSEVLCSPIEQVWRVRLHDDKTVALYSFAIPQPEKNLANRNRLNQVDMPQWVKEKVSVLQICQSGEIIEGVGQKVSDKVFYVIE